MESLKYVINGAHEVSLVYRYPSTYNATEFVHNPYFFYWWGTDSGSQNRASAARVDSHVSSQSL